MVENTFYGNLERIQSGVDDKIVNYVLQLSDNWLKLLFSDAFWVCI